MTEAVLAMPGGLSAAEELEWLRARKRLAEVERRLKLKDWHSRPGAWLCDREVCDGKPHDRWAGKHCRKIPGRSQALPEGRWQTHYKSGGRGSGKTKSSSEGFGELILTTGPNEWAIVAPTFADARDVCMAGPSGLIRALGGKAGGGGTLVEQGPWIAPGGWNVSTGQLRLLDGSIIYCDGADDGALRIQGKDLAGVWADEIGLWKQWKTAWDESIKYAVRQSPAKRIVSGTPKANRSARELIKRLLDDPKVPVDRLRTEDNADNLDPDQLEEWLTAKGTRLARQELEGELLTDREGALVTWDDIIPWRVNEDDLPAMRRVLVSVDPSFSNTEDSDECGITGIGEGVDGHGYVMCDWSGRYSLDQWAKRAVLLAWLLDANAIVYESNLVGQVVRRQLESAISDFMTSDDAWNSETVEDAGLDGKPANWHPPRLKHCQAKLPKEGRLEVVAPLWQQHRVHHCTMTENGVEVLQDLLEGQITSWVPTDKYSPDRMDSCTQGIAELNLQIPRRRSKPAGEQMAAVHASSV